MYTIENVFKFLHVLSVVVWLGGVLTVNVLQVFVSRGGDRAGQASLLRLSDLYGRAVIGPAAGLTLITGFVRVAQIDVSLGTFWVVWGLVAVAASIALGASVIRVTLARLRRLVEDATLDDALWPALRRRLATLYGVNLLVLLSALWAMEFKPAL